MRTKLNYLSIEGKYFQKKSSEYLNPQTGITLIIGHRKNPVKNKPPAYLLCKSAPDSYPYISSLYPACDGNYSIDYSGQGYKVVLKEGEMIISKS